MIKTYIRRILPLLAVCSFCFLLASCGGSNDNNNVQNGNSNWDSMVWDQGTWQ